jgi:hypothetical protein
MLAKELCGVRNNTGIRRRLSAPTEGDLLLRSVTDREERRGECAQLSVDSHHLIVESHGEKHSATFLTACVPGPRLFCEARRICCLVSKGAVEVYQCLFHAFI